MNKREVVTKVALESGIHESICLQVINTLEEVITEEANQSGGRRSMLDFAYSLRTRIRNKRENKEEQ